MFNSPAGGVGELSSSPAKVFVDASGSGGGCLWQAQVQALIDTSLGGAVQPTSVTTTGAVKFATAFSFDSADDGEPSKIAPESNGGVLLQRGGLTFPTLSPCTGGQLRR